MKAELKTYIDPSAQVKDSKLGVVKLYRNSVIINSILGDGCTVGNDSNVERCQFENNVIINRRSFVNDSHIGMYSYAGINLTMNWTKMGRFCSIGRNVDIGGFDHDYHKVTTMPQFRWNQMANGGGKISEKLNHNPCIIGNDVWIAAGAMVLHKAQIGDGAIVGGGAVVTHDIPPYAIAVGIPAKIIGYRFNKKFIDELLDIQWWNWPLPIIMKNMPNLIQADINEETIEMMREIERAI